LRARAEWHFGGGPEYCRGCVAAGAPCAAGLRGAKPATGPGPVGRLCPYRETALVSLEGWQAWDVASKCAGQLRILPTGGMAGIDFAAAFACGQALGYDLTALAELLPAAEAGMVTAINGRLTGEEPD
jgi:hypothetical protein